MFKKSILMLAFVLITGLFVSGFAAASAADSSTNTRAILVVSFGTSYNDSREITIGAIEKKIAEAFPEYDVRRAFTSQIIIDKLAERDNLQIDNVSQAMDRLIADGITDLAIQPTHIMNGYEYDQLMAEIDPYMDSFNTVVVGAPILSSTRDYWDIIDVINTEFQVKEGEALVLMGHGTEHFADAAYPALDYMLKQNGNMNIFIGTVEGYPDVDTVLKEVAAYGAKKVILAPLMIVAGDHANNDMAGDEEGSWKTIFKSAGYDVDCIIKGFGQYAGAQDILVRHLNTAINGEPEEIEETGE
ncbi:MAG: sirohydrochlorin cobaltochelatase [Flexilinea sp.]